jgi:hypothetical protein
MVSQHHKTERTPTPRLILTLAVLCLVSVAVTTPEVAFSTTQVRSTQLQDIESTQAPGRRIEPGESPIGLSSHESQTSYTADNTTISYIKLRAEDASSVALPARMQLAVNTLNLTFDDSDASYTLAIEPGFEQQAYLKASNPEGGDLTGKIPDSFGSAVAISGDTLVVSAINESSNATGVDGDESNNSLSSAGAVYVFVRSGTTWTQQAYLKASEPGLFDFFGYSVAISGNTLVVGALADAAYVFTRNGTTWSQQALLQPHSIELNAGFGFSVGISGNTIVVSGAVDDRSIPGAGAAYVFTRSGTTWTQQAYLEASNAEAADFFGFSVAIAGETLVVGAPFEDSNATGINGGQGDNSAEDAGAAYVFTRSGTTWSQQAYLKASNTDAEDEFGRTVAISSSTVVVGTFDEASSASGINGDESDNSAERAGAAYVFARNDTDMTWSQQAYLKASNSEQKDEYGWSVAISGETIVVGAWKEDSNATGTNGDQSNQSAGGAGAAYVFTRSGTVWSQQDYLKASNTERADEFGFSVAISGGTIVVGSLREDSDASGVNGDEGNVSSFFDAGAAYVFVDPSISSDTAINAGVALNGLFYDPANSGHGFDFNVFEEGFIAYYYGHTVTGERLWLISNLYTTNLEFGVPYELEMFEIKTGVFGSPVEPATPWGTTTITMTDYDSGTASFVGNDGSLDMALVRLVGLPEIDEDMNIENQLALNGLFYDSGNSGHGFDFNLHEAGLTVYYYGHTTDGERLWLISDLYTEELELGVPYELEMYEITTGLFGNPVEPATSWGTITVTFTDCDSGTASFLGNDGALEMDYVRLAGLPEIDCH